jgi:DNA (cytosine-5)-methyltransferase 1
MHDLALPSSGRTFGVGDACLFGLSLCSGAGGLDLGLAIAIPGYRAVGHVERETFAAATLVARMEDASLDQAVIWDDVVTFDGRPWRGAVDIVTAGYPCQPFSVAGKRQGADDPRHLWPHVARIIAEAEPPFVFLENVAHHLRLGFPEVASGLVGMGYKVAAGLFTAAEVGAPHRRERLFILAVREGDELADPTRLLRDPLERWQPHRDDATVADADGERRLQTECRQSENCGPDPYGRKLDYADRSRPQGWGDEQRQNAG